MMENNRSNVINFQYERVFPIVNGDSLPKLITNTEAEMDMALSSKQNFLRVPGQPGQKPSQLRLLGNIVSLENGCTFICDAYPVKHVTYLDNKILSHTHTHTHTVMKNKLLKRRDISYVFEE